MIVIYERAHNKINTPKLRHCTGNIYFANKKYNSIKLRKKNRQLHWFFTRWKSNFRFVETHLCDWFRNEFRSDCRYAQTHRTNTQMIARLYAFEYNVVLNLSYMDLALFDSKSCWFHVAWIEKQAKIHTAHQYMRVRRWVRKYTRNYGKRWQPYSGKQHQQHSISLRPTHAYTQTNGAEFSMSWKTCFVHSWVRASFTRVVVFTHQFIPAKMNSISFSWSVLLCIHLDISPSQYSTQTTHNWMYWALIRAGHWLCILNKKDLVQLKMRCLWVIFWMNRRIFDASAMKKWVFYTNRLQIENYAMNKKELSSNLSDLIWLGHIIQLSIRC